MGIYYLADKGNYLKGKNQLPQCAWPGKKIEKSFILAFEANIESLS